MYTEDYIVDLGTCEIVEFKAWLWSRHYFEILNHFITEIFPNFT